MSLNHADLLKNTISAFKKLLRVSKVNFFFINLEVIRNMQTEGITFAKIVRGTSVFQAAQVTKKDAEIKFSNITDVIKEKVCSGKLCVWPISTIQNPDDKICVI